MIAAAAAAAAAAAVGVVAVMPMEGFGVDILDILDILDVLELDVWGVGGGGGGGRQLSRHHCAACCFLTHCLQDMVYWGDPSNTILVRSMTDIFCTGMHCANETSHVVGCRRLQASLLQIDYF